MPDIQSTVEIFCLYAHEDEEWHKKLKTHLSILQRQGRVSVWHDGLIQAGSEREREIAHHLNRASLILLLVSADFFASDYCSGVELQRALERHKAGEARVLPILLRPVDHWQSEAFAELQALPTDTRFLTQWEDTDAALADVAAGIRRTLDDFVGQFANISHQQGPSIWNIPYRRNPFFLGRQELLSLLHRRFQSSKLASLSQVQAISGLGGVGKTQVAVEYAYRYRQGYQAILWARAETREELTASYMALAALLELPVKDEQEQQRVVTAVKHWLETHDRWLLILDNADDLALLPAFLPTAPAGHLLLTTRAPALKGLGYRLEVALFSPEQGALFLLRRAALIAPDALFEEASPLDCELALQITQELGNLPLALDQAGAYLEETGENLATYLQCYHQERIRLLQKRRGLTGDHPQPVTTTWSLSFMRIEEHDPTAADLLRFCAFLAPDHIPEELLLLSASHLGPRLAKVTTPFALGQAIESARAYSLITRDPTTRTLLMHRLVQAVLRESLSAGQAKQWKLRTLQAVYAAFPPIDFAHWNQCEQYVPHALVSARWMEHEHKAAETVAGLLNTLGDYLRERIRYAESEPLLQQALALREKHLGPEHPDTATCLNTLALQYRIQGRYSESEQFFQRALAIREKQLGTEHLATASSLHGLARLYQVQGRYNEAEQFFQRALAIREKQLGTEHLATASNLNNLAELYKDQGRYTEAEPLFQQALALREKQLGLEHPDTATSLHGLARLYRVQGRYNEAEPLLQQALTLFERQLGSEHPYTALCLNTLAGLYQVQGHYSEAEPLYLRELAIDEKQLGSEHPDTASCLYDLARLYRVQGRSGEAGPLYLRALAIDEKQLGSEHPTTIRIREDYSVFLQNLQRN